MQVPGTLSRSILQYIVPTPRSILLGTLLACSALQLGGAPPSMAQNGPEDPPAERGSRESRTVHLNGYRFDPLAAQPALPATLRFDQVPVEQPFYYIVQFHQRISPTAKAELRTSGAKILEYVPYDALLVRADASALSRVRQLASVRWVGVYEPAYKLSRTLDREFDEVVRRARARALGESGADPGPAVDTSERIRVTVVSMDPSELPAVVRAIREAGTRDVEAARPRGPWGIARAEVPRASLESLAHVPGVLWIEREVEFQVLNDIARWVVQSNDGVNFSVPLHQRQINGTGQLITVGDSGIDYEHDAFEELDPVSGQTRFPYAGHRKILDYYIPTGMRPGTADLSDAGDNHGTHVSGSVAGDDGVFQEYSGDPAGAGGAAGPHDGQAFDAKIQVQDLSTDPAGRGISIPLDIRDLFQDAMLRGSLIHTNSWGGGGSSYTVHEALLDDFLWNNNLFLGLFAAGNGGPDLGSVSTPGAAKNVVTLGASGNGASAAEMAQNSSGTLFSSRGPTLDGRLKPDVMAPGQGIWSAAGGDPGGVLDTYKQFSGTSMATPTVAGAAALVRQYFIEGWYPTGQKISGGPLFPGNFTMASGALVKAILINSAARMTGATAFANGEDRYPNLNQGWGRLLLDNALHFSGDARDLLIQDEWSGVGAGRTITYALPVDSSSQELEITLVWFDHRGMPSANPDVPALVNDLDLTVIAPNGTTYRGNQFVNSAAGGSTPNPPGADHLNSVEGVIVASPVTGVWSVRVTGFDVPMGNSNERQAYALVMTGGLANQYGRIELGLPVYHPDNQVSITVTDPDLNINPNVAETIAVEISSQLESTPEQRLLTETAPNSTRFQGQIQLHESTTSATGDGRLQVFGSDTVTARYIDAQDGLGGGGARLASATVDGNGPLISNIATADLRSNRVTVTWTTDEPASSRVFFGPQVQGPIMGVADEHLVTAHAVMLLGLQPSTAYSYFVVSNDETNNNQVLDDNSGQYYSFTTPPGSSLSDEPPNADWPMFQNNQSRHGAPAGGPGLPLEAQWSTSFSATRADFNGSIFAQDTLYLTTTDGFIRARQPYTGAVKWERQLGDSLPTTSFTPPSPSVPVYDSGALYVEFGTASGVTLYALDATTGATLWSRGPGSGLNVLGVQTLAVAGGMVFVPTDSSQPLVALNAATGATLWSAEIFDGVASGPTVFGDQVFVGTKLGMAALDRIDGKLLWSRVLAGAVIAPPVIGAGKVFFGVADVTRFVALDAQTGEVAWIRDDIGIAQKWQTPAYDGQRLYIPANLAPSGGLYTAVDPASGATLWQTSFSGFALGSPVVSNGLLHGWTNNSGSGALRVLDASNGSILAAIPLLSLGPRTVSLAMANDWVWVSAGRSIVHGLLNPNDPDDDNDGHLDDSDCDPRDPTVHPGAIEVCNGRDDDCDTFIDNGVEGLTVPATCGDQIDNDCDGVIDLDCAVDVDPGGQLLTSGSVTAGALDDIKAIPDGDRVESLSENSGGSKRRLIAMWTFSGAGSGVIYRIVAEAHKSTGGNDNFAFSYARRASGSCTANEAWFSTALTVSSTTPGNLQQAEIGFRDSLQPVFCVQAIDTRSGSDTATDTLHLDRLYLFPKLPCVDDDGDGYTPDCTDCTNFMCPLLDCNDIAAEAHPNNPVEGPPGSPSCGDDLDNDCNGAADGADIGCQVTQMVNASFETGPSAGVRLSGPNFGDYQATQASDEAPPLPIYEAFEERAVRNKGTLVHVWEFTGVPPALSYELVVEGYRTAVASDNNFKFQSAIGGTSDFTDVPGALIDSAVEIPGGRSFPFTPAGAPNHIRIRILNSKSDSSLDEVYVDRLAIRVRF